MSENLRERFAELPVFLANHLEIVVIALVVGVVTSVPLAVLLVRRPRLRYPVLTSAGVVQTVPGLALLALMVPLLVYTGGLGLGLSAFGFYPAVFALTLYSVLPILRNTVTGILGVDPALVEAARGVGMSPRQRLLQVELPVAAPVILAGIRTATVWTVGAATLATPVGQTCLGNYIFTGLQTRNWVMVIFGVVSAAVLAIVLDLCLGGLERAAATRRRGIGWLAGGGLACVVVLGLVSPGLVRLGEERAARDAGAEAARAGEAAPVRRLRVGAKTFTEQYILASLIEGALRDAGFATERVDSLGSTVIFDALVNGDVDVYVEYSGTLWANVMARGDVPPAWRVLAEVEGWLAAEHGVRSLGSLGFENNYGIAVRRADADRLGLETVGDLAAHAPGMTIGGDYEFFGRPEWRALAEAYDLRFADKVSFDSTFMYEALAAGEVDAISAFTSDGRIAAYDLVVLREPKQVIPPYHAMVVLGPRVAGSDEVAAALAPLTGAISVERMREANLRVDREEAKLTPAEAARWLSERLGR